MIYPADPRALWDLGVSRSATNTGHSSFCCRAGCPESRQMYEPGASLDEKIAGLRATLEHVLTCPRVRRQIEVAKGPSYEAAGMGPSGMRVTGPGRFEPVYGEATAVAAAANQEASA